MTVAVCLKCGALKHGALTPCQACSYTPQDVEDQAKHVMVSDHHFSQADLEQISARVQNGQPLHFDPKQVERVSAVLQTVQQEGKRGHLFLWGFFAPFALVILAVVLMLSGGLICLIR